MPRSPILSLVGSRRGRAAIRTWLCLIGLAVAPTSAVADTPVDAGRPSASSSATPADAGDTRGSDAERALAQARELSRTGRLQQAAELLDQALREPSVDPAIAEALRTELEFNLPVLRAQQHLVESEFDEAYETLQWAYRRSGDNAERREQLAEMLRKVGLMRGGVGTLDTMDERSVLRAVRQRLDVFFRENGRYPRGTRELARLLPADTAPLEHFDVAAYRGSATGFTLTLRNKNEPFNEVTFTKTGLLR